MCYICVFVFQRVHLDINVGEHAINYADVAQKEKLSELQLRVRQLLDQVEQITKEQNYQRVSEILHLSVTVVSSTTLRKITDDQALPLIYLVPTFFLFSIYG